MKRNCEFINLGEFEMTSPVMRVSDPCYERDVWCCGTVDHCKLGTWEAGVLKTDEGEWGTRCAVLAVRHKDTGPDFNVIRSGNVRKIRANVLSSHLKSALIPDRRGSLMMRSIRTIPSLRSSPHRISLLGISGIVMCATSRLARCWPVCCLMVWFRRPVSAMAAMPATHMLTKAARLTSRALCLSKNNCFLQGSASALPCAMKEVHSL